VSEAIIGSKAVGSCEHQRREDLPKLDCVTDRNCPARNRGSDDAEAFAGVGHDMHPYLALRRHRPHVRVQCQAVHEQYRPDVPCFGQLSSRQAVLGQQKVLRPARESQHACGFQVDLVHFRNTRIQERTAEVLIERPAPETRKERRNLEIGRSGRSGFDWS